jgi:hypothetical protein
MYIEMPKSYYFSGVKGERPPAVLWLTHSPVCNVSYEGHFRKTSKMSGNNECSAILLAPGIPGLKLNIARKYLH